MKDFQSESEARDGETRRRLLWQMLNARLSASHEGMMARYGMDPYEKPAPVEEGGLRGQDTSPVIDAEVIVPQRVGTGFREPGNPGRRQSDRDAASRAVATKMVAATTVAATRPPEQLDAVAVSGGRRAGDAAPPMGENTRAILERRKAGPLRGGDR